ncbi:hypothetical protein [Terriglobus sp. RCC_193]|uniref:hypothetical protein n=1 Tax=Terriglobus sp. RCC_193 TaxID=3239218 RepID=UPI0035234A95
MVRIRAADVRKRLATYYQSRTSAPTVRIDIPPGSYRAVFTIADEVETSRPETARALPGSPAVNESLAVAVVPELAGPGQSTPPPAPPPVTHPHSEHSERGSHPLWKWVAVASLLLLFGVYGWYARTVQRDQRALIAMWGPFVAKRSPVLISVGSNAVYRVSEPVADAYGKAHHLEGAGMEFFPDFSPQQTLASTGIQSAPSSFVAEGDVAAVAEAVTVLTSLHQPIQERFANNISFAEVQSNPTILIGGFNNPMSMELARNLRFTLTSRTRIEDHRSGGRVWILSAPLDARDTQDYAIVTRLVSHKEAAPVLEVAGLGQYGTLAAMQFVCDPDTILSLNKTAGPDWMHHNLQLVLRIRVLDYRPASTEIVAADSW